MVNDMYVKKDTYQNMSFTRTSRNSQQFGGGGLVTKSSLQVRGGGSGRIVGLYDTMVTSRSADHQPIYPAARTWSTPGEEEKGNIQRGRRRQSAMVLSRRNHARPTRRRHFTCTAGVLFFTSAAVMLLYLLVWHPLFSSSNSSSGSGRGRGRHRNEPTSSSFSSTPGADHNENGEGGGGGGDLPLAELLSGDPPYWRDPRRDFQAEYDAVYAAVPGLSGTRPARFAFLIMAHGPTDVKLLKRSLPWLYSPLNFFLVGSFDGCTNISP